MKLCPKCGRKWPDSGKFCPFDGASLQEEKRAETAVADIRTSATVVMEVPKDLADLKKASAPQEPASKKKQFSETQWFMKSIKPEELEEITSHDDGDLATEQYVKKEELKTEVRKKFSLADSFRKHKPAVPAEKKADGDAFLNLDRKVREKEKAKPAPAPKAAPAPAPAPKKK